MNAHKTVHRVAIVGTGTIGASRATHFLVRGFDVTATDPAPTAETALRSYGEAAWDAAAPIVEIHRGPAWPSRTPISYRRPRRSASASSVVPGLTLAGFIRLSHDLRGPQLGVRSSRTSCCPR
ncbi:3-hydroxyacyl-CoA dehydrogenase NAD-binding domain-containing protein [Streptomyces sp. NPDC059766]|uniref:3-hydroxyacyl-CoA dehydrogenase NAD-binding domain-containing protein n=1 Tax=Streptomyces sp. NPDC059766 TaxID=3346940 RepID=UPI0036584713